MQSWNKKLKCAFEAWRVLAENEIALHLPPNNICDMRGALEIAKSIMPAVTRIVVYVAEVPDVEYRSSANGWKAYDWRWKAL